MYDNGKKIKDPSRDKRNKSKNKRAGGDRSFSREIVDKTLDDAIEYSRRQFTKNDLFEPHNVVLKSLPEEST